LTGHNSLKTYEEMDIINTERSVKKSLVMPKGILTSIDAETKSINDLNILIGISDFVHRIHLHEFRLYDMAYCIINDNINGEVFVADQVKSARVSDNNLTFNISNGKLNIGVMISILECGSLTCIGKDKDNKIDVVWFFYGINSINILKKFNLNKEFRPNLHLTKKNYNEFTNTMNNEMFRFDVGKSSKECHRLLEQKIEFIKNGIKNSLQFWNEDDSQIPCENHRIEQRSFNMTRIACISINIKIERKFEYAYGPVDFIVNEIIRVQDKVVSSLKKFKVRNEGKLPYNPDDIDIFQVSDLVNNIVYAIPMRIVNNDIIISFFNTEQLMKINVYYGIIWKEKHKKFKYDFKNKNDILSYFKACKEANIIPKLTDKDFYSNMINENKDKFGSKKQLASRKANNIE
jgi:hypothetical protein